MTTEYLGGRLAAIAATAVLALTGCIPGFTTPLDVQEPPGGEQQGSDENKGSDSSADDVSGTEGKAESGGKAQNGESDGDPEGWESVVATTRSGVVHLTVTGCDPDVLGSGSGFLIAPDLVVTAAHVVEGATSTVAAVDEQLRNAQVLGLDTEADVALLQLDEPVDGYTFSWAEGEAPIGSAVAALGFPLGGGFSVVTGVLSGYDESETGQELLRITAPTNAGNSGGAIVTRDGEVIGVHSWTLLEAFGRPVDGMHFSVSHTAARPLVEGWRGHPDPPGMPACATEAEPFELTVDTDLSDPDVIVAALTVLVHGEAINTGSYESAFAMFTPQMQEAMGGLEEWSSGLDTSYWTELTLTGSTITEEGVELRMTLRTEQSPHYGPGGEACSDWDLTYALLWDDDLQEYFIDQVRLESDPIGCAQ
ncbi:trypsin-like peptidase domain-containing protein [Brachybacterium avium]|nr:trypsin-like peptidase domain-containing protein [Brachybacterium avium]